jgi:hypothetical protein
VAQHHWHGKFKLRNPLVFSFFKMIGKPTSSYFPLNGPHSRYAVPGPESEPSDFARLHTNTIKGSLLRRSATPSQPKKKFVSRLFLTCYSSSLQLKTVKKSTSAHMLCPIIQDQEKTATIRDLDQIAYQPIIRAHEISK